MPAVNTELRSGVATLRVDRPPVNAFDAPTCAVLDAALAEALADPAVRAVVITGTATAFSAGADIHEFERRFQAPAMAELPDLRAIIRRIEEASKPVVAAIDGVCLGGGFELALGCHFRIAGVAARFALPEVRLGIVPGAGGTQRLPRAIGLEAAMPLLLTGETLPAERACALGVAQLAQGDLLAAARAFAQDAAARREWPRLRDRRVPVAPGVSAHPLIEAARAALRPALPASLAVLECLEAAATLPFDEGIDFERRSLLRLIDSAESRALRYAFFSEREAARIPGLPPGTATRPIRRIAVVGAGTMGAGIAMCAANAGLPVVLIEQTEAALAKGIATIERQYAASAKKGRLEASEAARRLALLSPSTDPAAAGEVDLAIEAVFEDLAVKEAVFDTLDATVRAGAILASNTSTLDVNRIAAFTHRPQDVVGLHFFSPAQVMRLLEIVRGAATSPETLATALAFAKQIGKVGVVSGVCDGFIG
jgi:3-hydroxyacyl-CoA dehydrogenase